MRCNMYIVTMFVCSRNSVVFQACISADNPTQALAKAFEHEIMRYKGDKEIICLRYSKLYKFLQELSKNLYYKKDPELQKIRWDIHEDILSKPNAEVHRHEVWYLAYKYADIAMKLIKVDLLPTVYLNSDVLPDKKSISIVECHEGETFYTEISND